MITTLNSSQLLHFTCASFLFSFSFLWNVFLCHFILPFLLFLISTYLVGLLCFPIWKKWSFVVEVVFVCWDISFMSQQCTALRPPRAIFSRVSLCVSCMGPFVVGADYSWWSGMLGWPLVRLVLRPCFMWRLLATGGCGQLWSYLVLGLWVLDLVSTCCKQVSSFHGWNTEGIPKLLSACWWVGQNPGATGWGAQSALDLVSAW